MKNFLYAVTFTALFTSCNNEKKDVVTNATDSVSVSSEGNVQKSAAFELLDLSAGESVKQSMESFARGDVDAMTANFDDNIRCTWSGGDSLVGKQAVNNYFKSRWKLIDSLSITEPVILPALMIEKQSKYAPTGKWVLYWGMVNVKYKNGKKLTFWIHNVNHFNDAGKVDFIGQYMDRHPIIEATKGLK